MERHQRIQLKRTSRSIDQPVQVSPFQTRGFGVQQKAPSTPASKAELWENYQRSSQMTQRGVGQTRSAIQTKLSIGQPGDKYEQEADSVADRVMAMSEPTQVQREKLGEEEEELQMKPLAGMISPLVQREELPEEEEELQMKPEDHVVQREELPEEEEELQMKSLDNSIQRDVLPEEEEELQMKEASTPNSQLPTSNSLEDRLSSSKGGGSPLSDDVRSFMEPRFGADFSGVRVHTGNDAVQMNQDVNAQAFAHGSDVYFGAGKAPGKDALTAHELTHVVQQNTSDISLSKIMRDSNNPLSQFDREVDKTSNNLLGPFMTDKDKNGVPYNLPTKDYRSDVKPFAPALNVAAPLSEIPDPGTIPGWKTIRPEMTGNIGPFSYTEPASEYIVNSYTHSSIANEAWGEYKNKLIPNVRETWNRDGKARFDSYTQQAKGNPDLDTLVKEMHDRYNMKNIGGSDKGTISDQANQTDVQDKHTVSDITTSVSNLNPDYQNNLDTTMNAGSNGTVDGPVGKLRNDLRNQREHTRSVTTLLSGEMTSFSSAQSSIESAQAGLDIDGLKTKKKKEEDEKEEIESGQNALKKISPELARMAKLTKEQKEGIDKISTVIGKGIGVAETGSPTAIYDLCKSVADFSKWNEIQKINTDISYIVEKLESKYLIQSAANFKAATRALEASSTKTKAHIIELKLSLEQEKKHYEALASAIEVNWKGKDPQDGKVVAQAMRAIPIAEKVLRTLIEMRNTMPKLPDTSTRESQGYSLVKDGINSPGANALLQTAGWILGAPETINVEILKWQQTIATLQSVAISINI